MTCNKKRKRGEIENFNSIELQPIKYKIQISLARSRPSGQKTMIYSPHKLIGETVAKKIGSSRLTLLRHIWHTLPSIPQ